MQPSRSKREERLAKVILILLRVAPVADGNDHDRRKSLLLGCGARFPQSLLDVEPFLKIRTRLRGHETFCRWMPDEA